MIKKAIFILSLFCCAFFSEAQNNEVSGILLNDTKESVSSATVLLYKKSDSLNFLKFKISDLENI